jgi:hypothetical protein
LKFIHTDKEIVITCQKRKREKKLIIQYKHRIHFKSSTDLGSHQGSSVRRHQEDHLQLLLRNVNCTSNPTHFEPVIYVKAIHISIIIKIKERSMRVLIGIVFLDVTGIENATSIVSVSYWCRIARLHTSSLERPGILFVILR